jgi:hypothetical protein
VKHNINFLFDTLVSYDNDAQKSMFLWEHPAKKAEIFNYILHESIHGIDKLEHGFSCETRHRDIMKWLDSHYDVYTWPLHDIHFHTNIMEWISCPFTCLNEIVTMLDKVMKDNFHA